MDGPDDVTEVPRRRSARMFWPLWMERQVAGADFVLVVGSPRHLLRFEQRDAPGKGLGAAREGAIIRAEMYLSAGANHKFVPCDAGDEATRFARTSRRFVDYLAERYGVN